MGQGGTGWARAAKLAQPERASHSAAPRVLSVAGGGIILKIGTVSVNEANSNNLRKSFLGLYRKGGMFRRFECGDGWHRIIYDLSAAVEVSACHRGVDAESEQWPLVQQVKEKYGGLRFYL